ncbi:hypothetical protein [Candidatus Phycosocius spiralis]|uniref:Uncharacterized protein n=1 Tax=Candidatus Phycosocius spiralis TaxID=2815099 RepID=A0ABQ4PU57_9PROT|nr:hypothetical protein [Candidatus Phycosocius spiralis]GIU66536.1 hypothetical protein PsB1_0690 [Candidatus Phycosocius spiralis]
MITGLLFTLAQGRAKEEGRPFPTKALAAKPATLVRPEKPVSRGGIIKIVRTSGVVLGLIGLALLGLGGVEWSFDPVLGLKIQTAVLSFTLPAGVFS